ncbi:MAG: EamA family transporter [Verrucomicrobia bacterium]|nr:EamA family transporter [Verrucomicrobiota bacterium]
MKGVFYALLAALLFGASTPLAKSLLPQMTPLMLAGLLYLGSGVGLGAYSFLRSRRGDPSRNEAALTRKDAPWLAGAIVAGGVIGPVLLMWGLGATPASSASLLLNLEGVLTALLAWFVFKENFDRRIALGMALIAAGGVSLSWTGRLEPGVPWSSLAIVGACLAWAIDNNLTRKVSAGDPVQIAMLKGLVAGGVNTGLALALGAKLPAAPSLLATGVVGFFGYGVSLTLFVLALRHIGTARTGAYFSIAPFVGAAISVFLLGDKLTIGFSLAAVLMAFGVWLHLTERHEHKHRHELMEHEHLHWHDDHHQHTHGPAAPPGEPHSHPHRHEPLIHSHPHYPDIHHRHGH